MFELDVARPRRGVARAAGVLSAAWRGASTAGKLLRGRERALDGAPSRMGLLVGTLPRLPVMLVHGLGADKSSLAVMERRLHDEGYTVYSVSYSCVDSDLEACADALARDAAWLLEETGCENLNVVAHSLGGVVLRWAATHTPMRDRVSLAITLGSPHRGTPAAHLAPSRLPGFGKIISQLRPGLSEVVDDEWAPADTGTRWVTIAGERDRVVPARYASLPLSANVRNVVLPGSGHMTLTSNAHCMEIVLEELRSAGPPVPQVLSCVGA